MIGGPPETAEPLPEAVAEIIGGRPYLTVWRNALNGLTFEVDPGPHRWFVKWLPANSGIELSAEAERLPWAARFTPVPRVLEHGRTDDGEYLATAGLPGASAVADRWLAEPRTAVRALGAGLRALHEALPVPRCPFSWEAAERVALATRRADDGAIDPARWNAEHDVDLRAALRVVADAPDLDHRVVCHGDACAPNTLIGSDGRCTGHVDLGELGTADRWADLAIATWSTQWNYGPGWEAELLAAYGVAPDPDRTRYYRLLWDLGP
ncbi:MAG: phosphotransferase [Jatrophihabitans sp.]